MSGEPRASGDGLELGMGELVTMAATYTLDRSSPRRSPRPQLSVQPFLARLHRRSSTDFRLLDEAPLDDTFEVGECADSPAATPEMGECADPPATAMGALGARRVI